MSALIVPSEGIAITQGNTHEPLRFKVMRKNDDGSYTAEDLSAVTVTLSMVKKSAPDPLWVDDGVCSADDEGNVEYYMDLEEVAEDGAFAVRLKLDYGASDVWISPDIPVEVRPSLDPS